MGKVTGFLEIERQDRGYDKPETRIHNYKEFVASAELWRSGETGGALHGLRHSLLSSGLPGQQSDPRLEQSGLSRPMARGAGNTAFHQQFSGIYRAGCVPRRAKPPAPSTSRKIPSPSKPSSARSWTAAGKRAGSGRKTPVRKTGKTIAVVGSGPAGLACAQQLARAGHSVTLFEKSDRIGGLLRYGIPDFKMEKHLIDRRIRQMEAEGVTFRAGVEVGVNISTAMLLTDYDAVVLAGGAEAPRDLPIPGREVPGIHFAMDFLTQQNKRIAGDSEDKAAPSGTLTAKGKHVVVIGGGDTGSDCIGTSNRQGALSVTQLEILAKPPLQEDKASGMAGLARLNAYLFQPRRRRGARLVGTDQARGRGDGKLTGLQCVRVEWKLGDGGKMNLVEMPGSEFVLEAELVLLAMGFVGPRKQGLVEQAQVALECARQCQSRHAQLPDQRRQDFFLRRHAPGPVPGGVGDPRRAAMRERR